MSTLYVRNKEGEFVALSKETILKIKQLAQIKKVKQEAYRQTRVVKALAAWMLTVERKGLRLDAKDLKITRLPNIDRLLSQCDVVEEALRELRDV